MRDTLRRTAHVVTSFTISIPNLFVNLKKLWFKFLTVLFTLQSYDNDFQKWKKEITTDRQNSPSLINEII